MHKTYPQDDCSVTLLKPHEGSQCTQLDGVWLDYLLFFQTPAGLTAGCASYRQDRVLHKNCYLPRRILAFGSRVPSTGQVELFVYEYKK